MTTSAAENLSEKIPFQFSLSNDQIEKLKVRARAISYFEQRDCTVATLFAELIDSALEAIPDLKEYLKAAQQKQAEKERELYNKEAAEKRNAANMRSGIVTYKNRYELDRADFERSGCDTEAVSIDIDGKEDECASEIQKSFHIDINSLDDMLEVMAGRRKSAPLAGEPAKITEPVWGHKLEAKTDGRKRKRRKASTRSKQKSAKSSLKSSV